MVWQILFFYFDEVVFCDILFLSNNRREVYRMSLITQENYPETTIVYSINNCVKCRRTKMLLDRAEIPFVEVNIQDGDNMDDYISYLKGSSDKMAMPVVFPPLSTGMEKWNDFRQDLIKELKTKLS